MNDQAIIAARCAEHWLGLATKAANECNWAQAAHCARTAAGYAEQVERHLVRGGED